MYNKWKNTAYILHALTEKYSEKKQTPETEVHQEILLRSMKLLEGAAPEAAELIQPMVKVMLPYTVLPDDKDDRENGAGRHYYCACNTDGKTVQPLGGYYRNGKTVTLLQKLDGWYKVKVDGQIGYMMAKYLKVGNEVVSGTATVYNPNGNSYVNFRSGASLNASVISTVPVGTKITVLSKGTDWTKTEIDGVTGYISTWFLKF